VSTLLPFIPAVVCVCEREREREREVEEVGKGGLRDKFSVSEVSMVLTRNSQGNY